MSTSDSTQNPFGKNKPASGNTDVDNTLSLSEIGKIVDEAIEKEKTRWIFGAKCFLSGFGVLALLGLTLPTLLLKPIIQFAYPEAEMYADLKSQIEADKQLHQSLSNGVLGDSLIKRFGNEQHEDIGLAKFPTIKSELPPEVWTAILDPKENRYEDLLNKTDFFKKLEEAYFSKLADLFENTDANKRAAQINAILRYQETVFPCKVERQGDKYHNQVGNCGIPLNKWHNQCSIVIPKKTEHSGIDRYVWIRCPNNNFPKISVRIKIESTSNNQPKCEHVQFVEVIRSDQVSEVTLRVSNAVANQLGITGLSQTSGSFQVMHAD